MTTTTLGTVRRRETRTGLLDGLKARLAERRAMREFESALYGASPSLRSDLLAAKLHSGL
jgi:hypothetical protein